MFVHLMMGQGQTRDRTGTGTGTGHPNKKERNLKLKRKLQKCLKSHKYFNQVCPKISKDIEAHTHERRHGAAPEILKVASSPSHTPNGDNIFPIPIPIPLDPKTTSGIFAYFFPVFFCIFICIFHFDLSPGCTLLSVCIEVCVLSWHKKLTPLEFEKGVQQPATAANEIKK